MSSKRPSEEIDDESLENLNLGIFLKELGALIVKGTHASYWFRNIN